MSVIKKYKKDNQSLHQTNITFDGIKDKIIMKKQENSSTKKVVWGSLGLLALSAGAVALIVTIGINSNKPGLVPQDHRLSLKAVAANVTPLLPTMEDTQVQSIIRNSVGTFLGTETQTDEEIIHELLQQFDTIIENDNNYEVKAVESDREDYKFKEIITFTNLVNEKETYALYYNDAKVEEEIEDDEYEKESIYAGVAVKDEQEFKFRLELEEETETDESEIESTFYLFEQGSTNSYTKVTSSSEVENLETETEYSYEVVKNGETITSYEMEIEVNPEDNEVELSIELNEKEYSIERVVEDDETFFYVEIENDETDEESEWVYKKVITDGVVSYVLVE